MEGHDDLLITRRVPPARIRLDSIDVSTEVVGAWRRRDDPCSMPDHGAPDELRAARGILAFTLLGAAVWASVALIVWLIGR